MYIFLTDGSPRQLSSSHQPSNTQPKTPSSLSQLQYALTGSFAKMSIHRKSSPGFFAHTDLHSAETFTNSGSGGDSDSSSQDSLVNSVQTVNFPILKSGTSHRKSVETSQDRLVRSNSLLQSVLSIGKRKKLATIPISQNELIERLKKVLTLAIDLTVFTGEFIDNALVICNHGPPLPWWIAGTLTFGLANPH